MNKKIIPIALLLMVLMLAVSAVSAQTADITTSQANAIGDDLANVTYTITTNMTDVSDNNISVYANMKDGGKPVTGWVVANITNVDNPSQVTTFNQNLTNGATVLNISKLSPGKYNGTLSVYEKTQNTDERYLGGQTISEFIINKYLNIETVNVQNVTYLDDYIYMNVTLNRNQSIPHNISVKVEGNEFSVVESTRINDTLSLRINNNHTVIANFGDYDYSVYLNDEDTNSYWTNASYSGSFDVAKATPTMALYVTSETITMDNNTVTATAVVKYNGVGIDGYNVTFTLYYENGTYADRYCLNSTNSLGNAVWTFDVPSVGSYIVNATFGDYFKYNYVTKNVSLTAYKKQPNISVVADNLWMHINNTCNITATVTCDGVNVFNDYSVKFVVSDVSNASINWTETVGISGNVATLNNITLGNGSYKVEATFIGKDVFENNTNNTSFNVTIVTPDMNLNVNPSTITMDNNTVTATAVLTYKVAGIEGYDVTFTLYYSNGTSVGSPVSNRTNSSGHAVWNFIVPSAGSYIVNATFDGNGKYNDVTKNGTLTATKKQPNISVVADNLWMHINNTCNITATVTCDGVNVFNDYSVKFVVSDVSNSSINWTETVGISGNVATLNNITLGNGSYKVEATFIGGNVFENNTNNTSFNVTRVTPDMGLYINNNITMDNNTSSVYTYVKFNGTGIVGYNVTFVLNDENGIKRDNYTGSTGNQGYLKWIFSVPTVGNYTVVATFDGNGKYDNVTKEINLTATRKTPVMSDIHIFDYDYWHDVTNTTMDKNNLAAYLSVYDSYDGIYLTDYNVTFVLKYAANGTIVNESNRTFDNDNYTRYYFSVPTVGNYTIVATFNGNGIYENVTKEVNLSATRKDLNMSDLKIWDYTYNKDVNCTTMERNNLAAYVSVYDSYDGVYISNYNVTFVLKYAANGTIVDESNRTFDNDNYTRYYFSVPTEGNYTIVATFNGEGIYNDVTKEVNLTATKLTPTLTINATDIKFPVDRINVTVVIDCNNFNFTGHNITVSLFDDNGFVNNASTAVGLDNIANTYFTVDHAGIYKVLVQYNVDGFDVDYFYPANNETYVNVSKGDTFITQNKTINVAKAFDYDEINVITLKVTNYNYKGWISPTGNATLTVVDVYGKVYTFNTTVNDKSGYITFDLTGGLPVISQQKYMNTYTIMNVTYEGDDCYNGCSWDYSNSTVNNNSFIISPTDIYVDLYSEDYYNTYGDTLNITATVYVGALPNVNYKFKQYRNISDVPISLLLNGRYITTTNITNNSVVFTINSLKDEIDAGDYLIDTFAWFNPLNYNVQVITNCSDINDIDPIYLHVNKTQSYIELDSFASSKKNAIAVGIVELLSDGVQTVGTTATGEMIFVIENDITGEWVCNKTANITSNGHAYLSLSDLDEGSYMISLYYYGDKNYIAANDTVVPKMTVIIGKLAPNVNIDIDAPNAVLRSDVVDVTATITNCEEVVIPEGVAYLLVDGKVIANDTLDENGVAKFSFDAVNYAVGIHNLTVAYSGDDYCDAATSTINYLAISNHITIMNVTAPKSVFRNENVTVDVVLYNNESYTPTGNVSLLLNGEVIDKKYTDTGSVSFTFDANIRNAGLYNLAVIYDGDDYCDPATSNNNLFILEHISNIEVTVVSPTVFRDEKVTVNVLISNNESYAPTGKVNLLLDGIILNSTYINDGDVSFTFDADVAYAGVHELSVVYEGDGYCTEITSEIEVLTINKHVSVINVTAPEAVFRNENVTVIAKVYNNESYYPTGFAHLFVDGSKVASDALNYGVATFTFKADLIEGNHILAVVYDGNGYCTNATSANKVLVVSNHTSMVDVTAPETVFIDGDVTVTAVVSNVERYVPTGVARLLLDGNEIDSKELVSGVATFNFDAATYGVGVHKLVVDYDGDSYCDPATSAINPLNIIKHTTTLTADNYTVVAYDKTKYLTAKLVDESGNAVAGKTITFRYNAKVRTAVTDENGIASIIFWGAVVKNYTVAITFDGDDTYLPSNNVSVIASVTPAYVTISDIIKVAKKVASANKATGTYTVGTVQGLTAAQVSYLFSEAVKQLAAGKKVSTKVQVLNVKAPTVKKYNGGKLTKAVYVKVSKTLSTYGKAGALPTYVKATSSIKLGFNQYTVGFAKVLKFYAVYGRLPYTFTFK